MSQIMCSRTVKYRAAASPVYIIKADTSSVTIGSNVSYATYSSNLAFFRRVSGQEDVAYSCYYTVFRKKGSTYSLIQRSTSKVNSANISFEVTEGNTDAIVACMYDQLATEHSGYLAELEIPVRKNGDTGEQGEPGDDGQDAATLVFEPDTVYVPCDADGSVTDTFSQTSSIRIVIKGTSYAPDANSAQDEVIADYVNTAWGTSRQSIIVSVNGGTEDFEGYIKVTATKTLNGVTYTASGLLPVVAVMRGEDGSPGPRGLAGPMAYIAGKYDATVNYGNLLTDTTCPVVLYTDGYYWYPTEDYRGTGYPPSVANGWKMAYNFEMILTKVLFAQFAKLGGFVVSGDYMLSHYGELIDANGNKLTLTEVTDDNGFRSWQYNGVDAYTYFRDYDPMVEVGIIPTLETRVGVNQQYWNYYETTSDTFYMPVQNTEATVENANKLKQLTAGDHYYLHGADANGLQHCLLIRVTSYNSSNQRLYGYRERHIGPYKPTPYASTARMFRPAKVVNAVTGEEWMAGGKVHVGADGGVTVEGTIRAKNLYRNLCLFSNGVYSSEVFYISSLNDWSRTKGYAVGDYIIGRPDANAEPDFSSVGMVLCTYDADIIQMVPTSNNSWDSSNPLRLPAPKDFPGKVVEITGWSRTTSEVNMYVGSVMGSVSSMCLAVEVSGGKFVPAETATVIAIKTGTTTRFMSMLLNGNYYWTKLNEK